MLLSTPSGYTLAPSKGGKVLGQPDFEALANDERAQLQEAIDTFKEELRSALGRVPLWQRELRRRIRELDAEITELTVSQLIAELESRYAELPEVRDYLTAVRADVIENGVLFRSDGDGEVPAADDHRFTRYRVNLLVDNSGCMGAPVAFEDNPNSQNLVGPIEHVAHMGTLSTDFTLIRPGALHRANGGYLILDVDKLLVQPFA